MPYSIESIELFVREMPPDRMSFGIGKADPSGEAKATKNRRPRAILLTRLRLRTADGRTVTGVSGDRPSFGWLDKRVDRTPEEKLALLLDLVEEARSLYLDGGRSFDTAFELWLDTEAKVGAKAAAMGAEDLMGSYASALLERAVIDAVCRAQGIGFFQAFRENHLGIEPGKVHPELRDLDMTSVAPSAPQTSYALRHTVGLSDPIDDEDLPEGERIHDGEPETLQEYVERDGLRYLKIKIAGDADADLLRLRRIWDRCLVTTDEPMITLDGNEAYTDLEAFAAFVDRFEAELPGMFDHTLFIEQPLTRALTLDPASSSQVRRIAGKKPLVIDEADGSTEAFRQAFEIGYSGCSHKNCKGVFKSLLNFALCRHFEETTDRAAFISAEDLSNMPLVPLHQDSEVVCALGLEHAERNGHHYAFGLSHLTSKEKTEALAQLPELYHSRGEEAFLSIQNGRLQYRPTEVGFGSQVPPRWEALMPLADWREREGV